MYSFKENERVEKDGKKRWTLVEKGDANAKTRLRHGLPATSPTPNRIESRRGVATYSLCILWEVWIFTKKHTALPIV
jgi:hypothetical protein